MNKARAVQSTENLFPPSRDPERLEGRFDGGLNISVPADAIAPNQSPDLDFVRLLQGTLRQDFIFNTVGSAAASQIIALGEHRFITSGVDIFELIFRAYKAGDGDLDIQVLSGGWTTAADGSTFSPPVPVENVLLSWKSFFDSVFFADGPSLIRWDRESDPTSDEGADFPAGDILTDISDPDSEITMALSDAVLGNRFVFHYSVSLTLTTGSLIEIKVGFRHNGALVASKAYSLSSQTTRTWPHEVFEMIREVNNGDTLALDITLQGASGSEGSESIDFVEDNPVPLAQVTATKNTAEEAVDDRYELSLAMTYFAPDHDPDELVQIDIQVDDGGGFVTVETLPLSLEYLVSIGDETSAVLPVTVVRDGMGNGSRFRAVMTQNDFVTDLVTGGVSTVEWNTSETNFSIAVKGFNVATDGDPDNGITWVEEGGNIVNDLYVLDEEDPSGGALIAARFIGVFANRIVALQYAEDPQQVGWHVNGNPDDWVGDGSGATVLPSRSDPIDELMALEPISANTSALFRRRSIMRCVATGVLEPALAFYHWIENLGTESPFSIAIVPGGLLFLGHDRQVYFLSESGPTPVGDPIQEELENIVSAPLTVEGSYDPTYRDYTLAVPNANQAWIFDFGRWQESRGQEIKWFRNTRQITRPTIIQGQAFYHADGTNNVYQLGSQPTDEAYVTSPTLNQENRQAEYSLSRVVVRYEAEAATELQIRASGDGGQSWEDAINDDPDLASTTGNLRRAMAAFNVTGYDLRFRVDFPSDTEVQLVDWRAEIIERDQLGFE